MFGNPKKGFRSSSSLLTVGLLESHKDPSFLQQFFSSFTEDIPKPTPNHNSVDTLQYDDELIVYTLIKDIVSEQQNSYLDTFYQSFT